MATLQESANQILNEKNSKILPENIKEGVTIFNVTGTAASGGASEYYTFTMGITILINELAGFTYSIPKSMINSNAKVGDYVYFDPITTNKGVGTALAVIESITDSNCDVKFLNFTAEGIDTSDADATIQDIASDRSAYVNGVKLYGEAYAVNAEDTMQVEADSVEYNADNNTIENYHTITYPQLYRPDSKFNISSSGSDIASAVGLTSDKILKGNTILGVEGTAEAGEGIDTSDADATSEDIISGKTAYVNGEKIEGTIETLYDIHSNADNIDASSAPLIQITGPASDYGIITDEATVHMDFDQADLASGLGITSEQIASGATILGIEGTAESLDTSSATATAQDIVFGQTAYAKGEKITGTLAKSTGFKPAISTGLVDITTKTITENNVSIPVVSMTATTLGQNEIYNHTPIELNMRQSSVAYELDITSDKIVAGNTILGVSGTAELGTDTTDATAKSDDIKYGKSAYVNGTKVEGSVRELADNSVLAGTVSDNAENNAIDLTVSLAETRMIGANNSFITRANYSDIATVTNLTPEKIVSGVSVLGVTGTAVSGDGSAAGAKVFNSIEEMNADTEAKEGDRAVVYYLEKSVEADFDPTQTFTQLKFPKTVTFTSAPKFGYYSEYFEGDDGSEFYIDANTMDFGDTVDIMFDIGGDLSASYSYSSSTFTMTRNSLSSSTYEVDTATGIVKFNTTMRARYEEDCPADVKKMVKGVSGEDRNDFLGYYGYTNGSYSLLPTQFTAKPEYVYNGAYFGPNGAEVGTMLTNTDNTFVGGDHDIFFQISNIYNTLTPIDMINNSSINNKAKMIPTDMYGRSLANLTGKTDLSKMFYSLYNLQSIPGLDTSSATNMSATFCSCEGLRYMSLRDVSNVTNANSMFAGCRNMKYVELGNMPNLKDVSSMYRGCCRLESVPNLDTSKITSFYSFHNECRSLTTLPNYDMSNVNNMYGFCYSCTNLTSIPTLNMSKVVNAYQAFEGCTNLVELPVMNLEKLVSGYSMFENCKNLSKVYTDETNNLYMPKLGNAYYMFANCTNLTNFNEITVGSSCYNIRCMFYNCSNLTSINSFNVAGNGSSFSAQMMFMKCSNLVDLPFINAKFSTVEELAGMCHNLSNASVINVIKMVLNSTQYSYKNLMVNNMYSPLRDTKFTSNYYTEYLSDLTNAGWVY